MAVHLGVLSCVTYVPLGGLRGVRMLLSDLLSTFLRRRRGGGLFCVMVAWVYQWGACFGWGAETF